MSIEQEMLAIERERLEMERKRDKKASLRFIIGSVLLVLATSGLTLYLNMQQEKRSIVASERQWIVPMLLSTEATDYEGRLRVIDELISLDISVQMKNYLQSQRLAILASKEKADELFAQEQALLEQQKLLDQQAAQAMLEIERAKLEELKQEEVAALERLEIANTAKKESELQISEIKRIRKIEEIKSVNEMAKKLFRW